ncbi:MAG: DUF3179 domain-containing protein [Deltaproteobacteria bacterium]|nr:DUF3179 domain-containing protein [Deltaproteobacteria bacterium]
MRCVAVLGLAFLLLANAASFAEPKSATNGFDLSAAKIPKDQIFGGGPGKDGIMSVDEPTFVPVSEATWVKPGTPVLAVTVGDTTHVYPVHLMEYHQIVNDRFGEIPVVVSYDPLAGVPRAFDATVAGESATFGVSGLIHNHGFLLYDRQTESLWQQFDGRALSGPRSGTTLRPLPIRQETLSGILARHPRAPVLARPSPKKNNYAVSPFRRYWDLDKFLFPVAAEDRNYHLKEMVLGVIVDGKQRAYLGSVATAAGGKVEDEFAGKRIRFVYDPDSATFAYEVPEGVRVVEAYWLAWKAFFPDTEVWHP